MPLKQFLTAAISTIGIGFFAFDATAQSYDDLARQQLEWQKKRMQVDRLNADRLPTFDVPAPAYRPLPGGRAYDMPAAAGNSGLFGIPPAPGPSAPAAPAQVRGEGDCRHYQAGPPIGCYGYADRIAVKECGPAPSPLKVSTQQLRAHETCRRRVYSRVIGSK